jgi:predicted MPP superfamily phosphohydrolase
MVTVLVLALAVLIYGVFFEPRQIVVHHVWINSDRLAEVFGEKTVIQISDLHIQKTGRLETKLLSLLNDLKPDVIFLTGDYVRWRGDYEVALDFLSTLTNKVPAWGVLGDYDYSRSRKSCLFCHEPESTKTTRRHQVKFLKNSSEVIELPNGSILVGGIDLEGENTLLLKEKMRSFQDHFPAIILSHSPLIFDLIDDKKDVLILSGDTHGGQIMLPKWLWKALGYAKNIRYEQGYFEEGLKKMYVSRGIGTSHVPIRILRRPELVVFHFRPASPNRRFG